MSRPGGGAVAAVDLGATSGRVVLGRIGRDSLEIEDVHRFPNRPVRTRDGLHWKISELYRNVIEGLRKAVTLEPDLASIGIDSWAIDYGLVRDGRLLGVPYHYRDERTADGVADVHATIGAAELYRENGLQFLPFTTLYQLAVDREAGRLDSHTQALLIPDLIAYWLTGERRAERTNASTTGLLGLDGEWNRGLCRRLGLPDSLLPTLVSPGERIGRLSADVAAEIGAGRIDVVAVGSHDTASAVAAIPLSGPGAAYICSGTWSLIGTELPAPVTTEESRRANFTNELGVDGRIRFLRNAMGMWVLNECVAAWNVDLGELVSAAEQVSRWVTFDAEDPSLLPAGDMPARVQRLVADAGLTAPTRPELVRSILESLAVAYAHTLDALEGVAGVSVESVHMVGGASQNTLLCQLVAERARRPLYAGPVEATATGNVLVQARAAGFLEGSLEDLRAHVSAAFEARRHAPAVSMAPAGNV